MSIAKSASLRQIATFRAVARLGNVSMAAEELHLSQSAVSIQISGLEEAAGAQLVSRTGRGVRLTEVGEMLLIYADRLLALWNETSDEIATFLGEFTGTLRLGAVATSEYWLPPLLVKFVNENPKVKLNLHVANRDEIVRSLAAQEIDIAVMGRPPQELKVTSLAIAKNPTAFVASPDYPLMKEPNIDLARLARERLLVRERGSGTRNTVERLFKDAGLRLRISSELSSNEAIKQMCVAGYGPAYLSLHTCVYEMNAGLLKIVPLPKRIVEREWFVVHVTSHLMPQVAVAFERFLQDHAKAEIQRQLSQHITPLVSSNARPKLKPKNSAVAPAKISKTGRSSKRAQA
jgi:LysR family transcriptional regulator, low CO2-responsive transcriptional regulator